MSAKNLFRTLAVISVLSAAPPAAAQERGQQLAQVGYAHGVGEWTLINRTSGSVCYLTLTPRPIPEYSAYLAIPRGGPRCNDHVGRRARVWVLRGNELSLTDRDGSELAKLSQQNINHYAGGEWELQRAGTGYAPPDPGDPPPGDRPGQGYGRGEWNLINQANGSVCRVTLSNQLVPEQNAYRAFAQGGRRCDDWIGQSVAFWVVRGNTLHLASADGSELAKLQQIGPNQYAAGGLVLRRRGGG